LLLLHRRRPRPPDRRRTGHPRRRLRVRAGREHLDGRLVGADHPRRGGERLLARRPARRLDRSALPPRREGGDGTPLRPREASGRDRLAAEGELGGRRPEHDPLVCGAPGSLDRPRRLDDARRRQGMRALVTGGGVFLGSHLVERLGATGADPFVARKADYDLTRWDDAERLCEDAEPDVVYHRAAEVGGIGANRANPGRYWYANLIMGAHVLELARQHDVGKVVLAGPGCAEPKYTPVPFHEDDLWNGYPEETNAPYGVAKKSILVGAQSYREQYRTNAIFLLPANLYGPRDNFHPTNAHVIADLIRKMHESPEEVVLWGDGSPTREFLYVEDAAEAFVLAAERYDGEAPVNIGAGKEISIRELAELIAELTGFTGEITW